MSSRREYDRLVGLLPSVVIAVDIGRSIEVGRDRWEMNLGRGDRVRYDDGSLSLV